MGTLPHLVPGDTIGILGGGQLGWMLAREANRLGFKTCVVDGSADCSASKAADEVLVGSFGDKQLMATLAEKSDVITLETEHVDYRYIEPVEKTGLVRPSAAVFKMIQDRLRQREFLAEHGFPQTGFQSIDSLAACEKADYKNGAKAILKSRSGGYDGKGQRRTDRYDSLADTWKDLDQTPSVLEEFVPFVMEISVILARGVDGEVSVFPVAENIHRNHILHLTVAPARIEQSVQQRAIKIATDVAHAMDYVGTMAVEMFVMANGELLINEIAPRVHNSGHFTYGACETSQFEQHLRAVAGLPLGSSGAICPAVMLNLLGDLWENGEPDWNAVFKRSASRLYLYNKSPARPGRKMGHILVKHQDIETAIETAEAIYSDLGGK